MWPLLGGLVTGGAGLLGSIFSANQSGENTQAQIQASQQQQATQNAFSERMSSTAYQRAAQDMEAAGLNKSAMFGSGAAASSPSGSSIQAPMPQTKSPMEGIGAAANQVVSTAIQSKTFDKMTEEIANLKADREVRVAQEATERQRPALLDAERRASLERAEDIRQSAASRRQDQILKGPETLEKQGAMDKVGGQMGRIGAVKYLWDSGTDIVGTGLSSALGVKRLLPQRSTTQRSRVDNKGNSFDEFWEKRTGYGN